jgi:para-nitrobenzyl esterase
VVGVNYRLGALGYVCHPGIGEGNFGLGDQRAALEWVRNNIAAFGGNPDCVTLCGQSAGAGSVAHLLLNPACQGLFRRVILQSAPLGEAPRTVAQATETANELLALLDIDPGSMDLPRLRKLPVADILTAQVQIMRRSGGRIGAALPFGPVVSDSAQARGFVEAAAIASSDKDILIGCTREEMRAFFAADPAMVALDEAGLARHIAELAGDVGAIEPYRRRRPHGRPFDLLCDFLTDRRFSAASRDFATVAASRGANVWGYRFDWSPPNALFKACRCIELPFVFGNGERSWPGAAMLAGGDPAEMARLQELMMASWIAFIRHGDPNHSGGPDWPRYAPEAKTILSLSATPGTTNWA